MSVFVSQITQLKKRFSEFSQLHCSLSEKYSEINHARFPKKAVFSSKKVNEDRKVVLNDYVKILAQLNPLPGELINFLQLTEVNLAARPSKGVSPPSPHPPSPHESINETLSLAVASNSTATVASRDLKGPPKLQV